MNDLVKLNIASSKADRLEVGRILLANGYKVWTEARKANGKRTAVLLMAEKTLEGANQNGKQEAETGSQEGAQGND